MPATRLRRPPRGAAPPRGARGRFGFLDGDDPDAERVIRDTARAAGEDPEQLLAAELDARRRASSSRTLDQLLADDPGIPPPGSSARPAAAPPAAGRAPTVRLRLPGEAGGAALGLLAWALAVNYLRYGPAGVKGWVAAKFGNRPFTPGQLAGGGVTQRMGSA